MNTRDGGRRTTGTDPHPRAKRRASCIAPWSGTARAALMAALMASLTASCGGLGEEDGIACTTEVRTSVIVHVVDQAGVPLAGATVTYRVDGGTEQAATCHQTLAACTDFQAGQELSGEFGITARRAGFLPASATVTVDRDVCHVQTQQLTLTLRPV